ncbi:MAG: orotate phosphoribosyltransferase [Thermodesulfobacteriaceae bacterium]|nr:orotate phosphoribosyltransferase [Thermodesulfobacteriaceae bacterium]MCX8041186.1 orotate phosphoribosyltransferase [Thermodesulfobacteriaceae bacterium]MDW8135176.1 orotate phosphoribosyltransferase [Thermodesulfobacterium sp.]
MERRKYFRTPFSSKVKYICKNKVGEGEVENISYEGLFLKTKDPLEVGEEIYLIIYLEGCDPPIKLEIRGEVVWGHNHGFGIKIIWISPESYTYMRDLIYYNLACIKGPEEAEKELKQFLRETSLWVELVKVLQKEFLKEELFPYILERAFLYSPNKPFLLASGKESPYYLDCRKITLFSNTFNLIGALFWNEIKYLKIDGVAGMSMGADPIVSAVLAQASSENIPLEGLLIRKEPKPYGTQKQIEGNFKKGMIVVLVEDVVTTGSSLIKAISACKEAELQIVKILALIDREEGGKENLKELGYHLESFFTLKEIIERYNQLKSSSS